MLRACAPVSFNGLRSLAVLRQSLPLAVLALACALQGAAAADELIDFHEAGPERGIDFRHFSPQSEQRHLHLTMGSGVAWIDFDRDGASDLYFSQGAEWTGVLVPASGPTDRLFRQVQGTFRDVTGPSCVVDRAYGMGLAVGDMNLDGFPDLYVSNFGPNQCYVNNGDGTFTQCAGESGLDNAGYAASCTWFDADADGDLDLFVVNYVDVAPTRYKTCIEESSQGVKLSIGCPPRDYDGVFARFFRNLGNGRFEDQSRQSGIQEVVPAQGLGVVAADLDDDGDQDIYVANDSVPNHQWMNEGQGKFIESALIAGTALNRFGRREAGMGVDVGDADGDGLPDLFVTNFQEETNTLYRNEGAGLFTDITDTVGLGAPSRAKLGFGTNFLDADNDGDLDLFIANGHIHDRLKELGRNTPYEQPAQLMLNEGKRFRDASDTSGDYFSRPELGRGSALCDFDRDGRIDMVINNLDRPAALLHNHSTTLGQAMLLRLVGTTGNRDGIGAKLQVDVEGKMLTRLRKGSSSYLSCDDEVIHVGIGNAAKADVVVYWPSGLRESWPALPVGNVQYLVEGRGAWVEK